MRNVLLFLFPKMKMTTTRFTIKVLLLTAICSILVSAQNARRAAESVFPSVVLLVIQDSNGQTISLGSGFFVTSNVVATNVHVIESASRGYAKIIGQRTKYDILGIVGIDASRDLVLLSLDGTKAPSLSLGDSSKVAVGDDVYAFGNPQGLEGTLSQGIISSIRKIGNDSFLQITAPISPGSSGGPIVNSEGKVVGVAVATLKGGQNLNFAIPSAFLAPLVSNIRSLSPLSTGAGVANRSRLSGDLGGRITHGVSGSQWTWTVSGVDMGLYSFTLHNELRESVRKIQCLVVFLDKDGKPLDVDSVNYSDTIPAGLARRVTSHVDGSVQKLAVSAQFRILDFEVID